MKNNIRSHKMINAVRMNIMAGRAVFAGLVLVISMTACNDNGGVSKKSRNAKSEQNTAKAEGVTLLIKDAALIQVDSNPEYNTAEWHFTVKKPGRYDVWLSSLTCDTLHLEYNENVVITAGDSRLTKMPVGDEIVIEDKSVQKPWYRADSHMGSVFFSKPGEYQVQVISDRVEPHATDLSDLSIEKRTLINSLILKPKVN